MEGRPSTSASLLSVSTPSSQFDTDDLDSDLQSVQSEILRHEGERVAHQEPELEKDFILQLAETLASTSFPEQVDIPTKEIKNEINRVLKQIHDIIEGYSTPPLANVDQAEEDSAQLKVKKLPLLYKFKSFQFRLSSSVFHVKLPIFYKLPKNHHQIS